MPTLFLTQALKIYDGEKRASSSNVVGESGYAICKKLKVDSCLTPSTGVNSNKSRTLISDPKL
jgi:hypothetical protein